MPHQRLLLILQLPDALLQLLGRALALHVARQLLLPEFGQVHQRAHVAPQPCAIRFGHILPGAPACSFGTAGVALLNRQACWDRGLQMSRQDARSLLQGCARGKRYLLCTRHAQLPGCGGTLNPQVRLLLCLQHCSAERFGYLHQ